MQQTPASAAERAGLRATPARQDALFTPEATMARLAALPLSPPDVCAVRPAELAGISAKTPARRPAKASHEALPEAPAKPAAVLVPLVAHAHGVHVLLTQRTAHLRSHAGQIAFPGGRMDPCDAGPAETALREAREEIGLPAERVEVRGYLDAFVTGTGYRVVPVVGIVRPGFALRLNPAEVADAFEVPLAFLMSEANHARHRWERDGAIREAWAMPWGERFIWGVTASILRGLWERHFR